VIAEAPGGLAQTWSLATRAPDHPAMMQTNLPNLADKTKDLN